MEMISSRNVQEVVLVLKKELVKTHDQEYEKVQRSGWRVWGYDLLILLLFLLDH